MTRLSKTIKEYVKCPQLGSKHYGEWGILRKDQRLLIHQLCEECEEQERYADEFYKNKVALQKENEVLHRALELACYDLAIQQCWTEYDKYGKELEKEYLQQAKEQRDEDRNKI